MEAVKFTHRENVITGSYQKAKTNTILFFFNFRQYSFSLFIKMNTCAFLSSSY